MIKLINRGKYDIAVEDEFMHLTARLSTFLSQIFDENGVPIPADEGGTIEPSGPAWHDLTLTAGMFSCDPPMTIADVQVTTYGYFLSGEAMTLCFDLDYTLSGTMTSTLYLTLPAPYRARRRVEALGRVTVPDYVPSVIVAPQDQGHVAISVATGTGTVMTPGAARTLGEVTIPVYQAT